MLFDDFCLCNYYKIKPSVKICDCDGKAIEKDEGVNTRGVFQYITFTDVCAFNSLRAPEAQSLSTNTFYSSDGYMAGSKRDPIAQITKLTTDNTAPHTTTPSQLACS